MPAAVRTVAPSYLELGKMDRLAADRTTTREVGVVHQHPNLLNRGEVTNDLLKAVGRGLEGKHQGIHSDIWSQLTKSLSSSLRAIAGQGNRRNTEIFPL